MLNNWYFKGAAIGNYGASVSRTLSPLQVTRGFGGPRAGSRWVWFDYKIELRNGEASASFVMDHGRFDRRVLSGVVTVGKQGRGFAGRAIIRPHTPVKRARYFAKTR